MYSAFHRAWQQLVGSRGLLMRQLTAAKCDGLSCFGSWLDWYRFGTANSRGKVKWYCGHRADINDMHQHSIPEFPTANFETHVR